MEFYYDEIDKDVLVLDADGGLNSDTAEQFVTSIEKLVDAGLTKLIVDCSNLDYISSYGLGILVRLHQRLKARGGHVKICAVKGLIAEVLEFTRLGRLFQMYPDVGQARLAFRPKDTADVDVYEEGQ